MKVTQEIIDAHIKNGNMVPHPIEGIPEGMSFFMKKEGIEGFFVGYLVAYKIGSEQMSTKPIMYRLGASEEEIKKEYQEQEKSILENYKKL